SRSIPASVDARGRSKLRGHWHDDSKHCEPDNRKRNQHRMSFHRNPRMIYYGLIISVVVLTQACQWENTTSSAATFSPPLVSVATANAESVPIYSEYAAQTFARDMVEVRGRVDGYVEKRLFQVGSDVKAGQPLYILD